MLRVSQIIRHDPNISQHSAFSTNNQAMSASRLQIISSHLKQPYSTAKNLLFRSPKMKAVIIDPKNKSASLSRDRAPPKLRDDYILVKTVAVALNPTDWKHIAGGIAAEDGLSGCDYSGVVEEVGKSVTKNFKKGDKICG
jgi:hypothetical protein